jgi:hypothetical protein
MSNVSMMSLMPSGMPSIGDNGRPPRQRPAERSAAARGGDIVADESTDGRFERLQASETAFKKVARRVAAGPEIRSDGKEWKRLWDCHCSTP